MQVSRDEDFGALSSSLPDQPCGCYFESRATGRTECADDNDCSDEAPTCRSGYCEAR